MAPLDPDSGSAEPQSISEETVAGSGPVGEVEQAEPVVEPSESGGFDDFGDLMADLGATPVSAEDSALAIRDATIRELRSNLAGLRSLGDQLAETEKARLALESQLAEQHVELAHTVEQHHAEQTKAAAGQRKVEAGRERAEDRLRRLRGKFGQRDRMATERWHKIRALQQELKALRAELKQVSAKEIAGPAAIATRGKSRPCLAKLFDPDPDLQAEDSTRAGLKAPDAATQPSVD